MKQNKLISWLARTEICIGAAIIVCLLVCHGAGLLGIQIQTLAACTGAVMCVQETGKASYKAGLNRVLGVICGGIMGVAIVLADNVLHSDLVFYLLCGVGIVLNLLLCQKIKMPLVQARVSAMTLLLVVLVLGGDARIAYAIGRFFGTLCGAVVATGMSFLWSALFKKENVHQ